MRLFSFYPAVGQEYYNKGLNGCARGSQFSLRSKRFGKAFRTFNALFAFLAAGKLGRAQKAPPLPLPAASISVALAPIFAQPKSKKRLQRTESPKETLATQFLRSQKAKTPPTDGKPYGNACYAD